MGNMLYTCNDSIMNYNSDVEKNNFVNHNNNEDDEMMIEFEETISILSSKCLLEYLASDMINLILYFSEPGSLRAFGRFGWITNKEYHIRVYDMCCSLTLTHLIKPIPWKENIDYELTFEFIR